MALQQEKSFEQVLTGEQLNAAYGPDWQVSSRFGFPGIGPYSFFMRRDRERVEVSREGANEPWTVRWLPLTD